MSSPRPTAAEIEQRLAAAGPSPNDLGTVDALCLRPVSCDRREVDAIVFTVAGGADGDIWNGPNKAANGDREVGIINARILRAIEPDPAKALLAGDQLIVDLDLSERNLPANSLIGIGDDVVLEITTKPHPGCAKFNSRFGKEALQWTRVNPEERRRGAFARVMRGGVVRKNDRIRKLSADGAAPGPRAASTGDRDVRLWSTAAFAMVCVALGAAVAWRLRGSSSS